MGDVTTLILVITMHCAKAPQQARRLLGALLCGQGYMIHLVLDVLWALSKVMEYILDHTHHSHMSLCPGSPCFAVDCVATCEVNLSNIWEGLGGDMVDQAFELTPSADRMQTYSTGCMGSVQVTLYAAAAFKALRRWGWQRYKADGADTG